MLAFGCLFIISFPLFFLLLSSPMLQLYLLAIFISFLPAASKQFYDSTTCSSPGSPPGSRYACNTNPSSCNTFVVYRSHQGFNNASDIAGIFGAKLEEVLVPNNLTNTSLFLKEGQEILVPINCSCSGGFSQSELIYTVPSDHTTYSDVSCDVFDGLVKSSTLEEVNPYDANIINEGLQVRVPLKCACPDENDTEDGFQYLVTYPIHESDDLKIIAKKFSIPVGDLSAQNKLEADATVYTNTTILVPLRNATSIRWSIDPSNGVPGIIQFSPPTEPVEVKASRKNLYIIGSVLGVVSAFIVLSGMYLCYKSKSRKRGNKLEDSTAQSSTSSCLSPDLVAIMSKYSLASYTVNELSEATQAFSEETQLGTSVHKAQIGDIDLVIKKMGYGDARRTIGIHSRINHANIVKLEGVCYGDDEFYSSFLVFEFARNGCLRNCLNNSKRAFSWQRRTQIAFDAAIGLHYIHHCTVPSYIHMNITSKNILITEDWRAKIANLGAASVINSTREWGRDVAMTSEGWIAPEYLRYGMVSAKVDVFAFGVVLFELLSGAEIRERSFLRERLSFLHEGGGATDCLDELRGFLDPNLKDYPIADVLCMAVLAKGCVEEDPMHRPSMNDTLKVLARIVR